MKNDIFKCSLCGKYQEEIDRVIVGFKPVYKDYNGEIFICMECLSKIARISYENREDKDY
ncbi:Uncharacterised protein [[Clostridium] sordellii]|uniref:ClpX C4-type zinc finger protein n=1 Tax=Paraclostridium sordellii TaxID=1505 RepID=UPI0005E213C5|nr:ClpX C4-type zinc finger protein [Paeniclostridium sordellii]CEQ01642.1 Uncharacterised protein [[Clostridium] sordellii] [Paeniclostridium sordellii]